MNKNKVLTFLGVILILGVCTYLFLVYPVVTLQVLGGVLLADFLFRDYKTHHKQKNKPGVKKQNE